MADLTIADLRQLVTGPDLYTIPEQRIRDGIPNRLDVDTIWETYNDPGRQARQRLILDEIMKFVDTQIFDPAFLYDSKKKDNSRTGSGVDPRSNLVYAFLPEHPEDNWAARFFNARQLFEVITSMAYIGADQHERPGELITNGIGMLYGHHINRNSSRDGPYHRQAISCYIGETVSRGQVWSYVKLFGAKSICSARFLEYCCVLHHQGHTLNVDTIDETRQKLFSAAHASMTRLGLLRQLCDTEEVTNFVACNAAVVFATKFAERKTVEPDNSLIGLTVDTAFCAHKWHTVPVIGDKEWPEDMPQDHGTRTFIPVNRIDGYLKQIEERLHKEQEDEEEEEDPHDLADDFRTMIEQAFRKSYSNTDYGEPFLQHAADRIDANDENDAFVALTRLECVVPSVYIQKFYQAIFDVEVVLKKNGTYPFHYILQIGNFVRSYFSHLVLNGLQKYVWNQPGYLDDLTYFFPNHCSNDPPCAGAEFDPPEDDARGDTSSGDSSSGDTSNEEDVSDDRPAGNSEDSLMSVDESSPSGSSPMAIESPPTPMQQESTASPTTSTSSPPGLANGQSGFINVCYINAVVQALNNVFWRMNIKIPIGESDRIASLLKKLFAQMRDPANFGRVLEPIDLVNACITEGGFGHGSQADANELYELLVERLHRNRRLGEYDTSPYRVNIAYHCTRCDRPKKNLGSNYYWSILIPKNAKLIQNGPTPINVAQEVVRSLDVGKYGENLQSERCKWCKDSTGTKGLTEIAPPIVVLQCAIFDLGNKGKKIQFKLDDHLDIELPLVKNQVAHYKLEGLLYHVGPSVNTGHYVTDSISNDGKLYRYNDGHVAHLDKLVTPEGYSEYLLFYRFTGTSQLSKRKTPKQ